MPLKYLAEIFLCPIAIFIFLALSLFPTKTAPAQPADAPPPGEIQKTIDILENDDRRQEIITLLKLMAVLEEQQKAGAAGPAVSAVSGETPAGEETAQPTGLKAYLRNKAGQAWRDLKAVGPGLRQSWRDIGNVFQALAQDWAVEIWRPYLLKTFIWGLACLLATWLIIKRYGQPPEAGLYRDFRGRLKALLKYILIVTGPNLVLIFSLLALPELSTTAPGVTADLATGFTLVHGLIQSFFVNLSMLYISLRVAQALFTPDREGHCLINLHPVLARHFLASWRALAVYTAIFILIQETFVEHFVNGVTKTMVMAFLTLPVPIYLTFRLLRLRRLVHLVSEAEASAGPGEEWADAQANSQGDETEFLAAPESKIDYLADIFIKKYWSHLALASVWILSFISMINPAGAADRFVFRLASTLAVAGLTGLAVKLIRLGALRLLEAETEHGRRLVLHIDSLTNFLAWPLAALIILTLWGLPLTWFLENQITRDILGRAFAIAVVAAVTGIFIRFSRLATEWLLAMPNLAQNRNWRTMAPLALTAARSLAIFIGVVAILDRLGVNVGPILAGAGILGLGVGLGAQSLVKDIINGITILMMDTLAVGDWVAVGGKSGAVESLGLRAIRLRDASGNLTVIPNSSVDSIVNMTRDYSQDLVEFTVPYNSDPDAMLQLARDEAQKLSLDPQWSSYFINPTTVMGVTGFDANGTTIRMKISTTTGNQWAAGRELRLRLKRRLLQEGVTSASFGQNVFLFRGEAGQASPVDEGRDETGQKPATGAPEGGRP